MLIIQKSITGLPVFITDITDFNTQLILSGGAFGFQWNPACAELEEKNSYGFGSIAQGAACIMVSKEAYEEFTASELAAIIAHEEAHHLFGHVAAAVSGDLAPSDIDAGAINVMGWELQADKYAAKHVGAKEMSGAIAKLVRRSLVNKKAQAMFGIKIPNSHYVRKHRRAVMRDMRPRFDALRAMNCTTK